MTMGLRGAVTTSDSSASGSSHFDLLFDREFSYVWNTLRRLGICERDLEDVTHEVFLQIYTHWAAFDPARAARPWLFGFAYRIAADYRRLARHRMRLVGDVAEVEDEALPGAGADQDDAANAREAAQLVDRALDRLELEQRAVLVMHDIDGSTMGEVAAALAIPVNTGYSRLRLARARFSAVVRKMKGAGGDRS